MVKLKWYGFGASGLASIGIGLVNENYVLPATIAFVLAGALAVHAIRKWKSHDA